MSKNLKIEKAVANYYDTKIEQHGPTSKGVDWNGKESQELRFEQLLTVVTEKKASILDLGCGSGIVSIIINDKLENNIFYASDLSKNSIVCCDKNFKKFKIKGIIKSGSLFKPWTDKKFDFIINDISGISSILSNCASVGVRKL